MDGGWRERRERRWEERSGSTEDLDKRLERLIKESSKAMRELSCSDSAQEESDTTRDPVSLAHVAQ